MYYTYFHTRNDTGAVFYVGKGKGDRARDQNRNPQWNAIVQTHGHQVHIAAHWETNKEALEHEKFLILCFKDMNIQLTNMNNGGAGNAPGKVRPDDVRKKISASRKGIVFTPETIQKMRDSHKGKKPTDETRAKMSASRMGHQFSEESRKKIGDGNRGKVRSAELRERISASVLKTLAKKKFINQKERE
jgi:hypothetical protein